jgi:hypothetical protein
MMKINSVPKECMGIRNKHFYCIYFLVISDVGLAPCCGTGVCVRWEIMWHIYERMTVGKSS